MTNNNNNLKNIPYAAWLEQALQELIKFPVKGICLNAVTENGEIYTNYYEVTMANKLTIAGIIQQDAMLDTLAANGYSQYADEDEDSTQEDTGV